MLRESTLNVDRMNSNIHLIKSVNKEIMFSKNFDRENSKSHAESQRDKSLTSELQQLMPEKAEKAEKTQHHRSFLKYIHT